MMASMLPLSICLTLLLSILAIAVEPNLDWGTYRPGYYFGLRARHPRSPLFGFMWYDAGKYEGLSHSRHACQDSDRLSTYGWYRHNADDFGQQMLIDPLTNLRLTTSFVKFKYEDTDDDAWLSIVDARTIPNGPDIASGIIGTVWYVVSGEHANDTAAKDVLSAHDPNMFGKKKKYSHGRVVQLDGAMYPGLFEGDDSNEAHTFSITQIMDQDNKYGQALRPTKKGKMKVTTMDQRTYVTGVHLSEENKWKAKSIFAQLMETQAKKLYKKSYKIIEKLYPDPQQQQQIYSQFSPNLKHGVIGNQSFAPNIFLAQNYLIAPFRIYYVYLPTNAVTIESLADLPAHINSRENINLFLKQKVEQFDARFEDTFNVIMREKPADDDENMDIFDAKTGRRYISPGEMQLARYAFSNLAGGIGYWFGNQIYQMRPNEAPGYTPDMTLLSAVPSRSFFPRGFLWDEGFHELIIGMWNMDLSMNIIESWLQNMDNMGWIAREQILGDEARARVPEEFQIQRPHIANPPTMFLAIEALLTRYGTADDDALTKILCTNEEEEEIVNVEVKNDATQTESGCGEKISQTRNKMKDFLETYWDKLVLHFDWYRITQTSPNDDNGRSFRWNGRQKEHNLPSGLDDYPRYENVTANEGHVDMHCWMIVLYRVMSEFAEFLGHNEEAKQWSDKRIEIKESLDEYHWNEEMNAYQDYAMVPQILEGENWSNASGPIIKVFANHIGYVSSFPFLLQVMDPLSPHLLAVLSQIRDEDGMWSAYGLRSLAKSDALYGTGEDYWRGAIWMNMNYLAVKALHDYRDIYAQMENRSEEQEEILNLLREMYRELRENLIKNLYREYSKFGFLYENYNGDDGNGQRSKPFTGWSALILNIITEIYP